jgi:hypothetical protein
MKRRAQPVASLVACAPRFRIALAASAWLSLASCNWILGIQEGRYEDPSDAGGAELDTAPPGAGGASDIDAGVSRADSGHAEGGSVDASVADAAADAGASPDADDPITLELTLTRDTDDATWISDDAGVRHERLHYDDRTDRTGLHIEVGNDKEAGRIGLRFELPVPPHARIDSAKIKLHRYTSAQGPAAADASMLVQVYETTALAVFDPTHVHAPEAHGGDGGVWATPVSGFKVGEFEEDVVSPDLKTLVQHVVDKAAWTQGGVVGFLLSPDEMATGTYADYVDSSWGANRPVMTVVYRLPSSTPSRDAGSD